MKYTLVIEPNEIKPKTTDKGYRTWLNRKHREWDRKGYREYTNQRNKRPDVKAKAKIRNHNYQQIPQVKNKKNENKKSAYRIHKTKDPIQHMVYRTRHRAKYAAIQHTITKEDLLPAPTHCPVFGYKLNYLNFERGFSMPYDSASVDRIDSSKGYIPGNVMIISWRANRLKADSTTDEIKQLYEFYVRKLNDNR